MRKTFHQPLSIVAIFLLLSQTFFGSMPVFAQTTSNTQPSLTVTMTENGQPYVEGNVATSPVTIQVQATSPDSAGVQIELSQDLGATWQQFDTITPLVLEDVGDHDVWFKVSDSLGHTVIEKRIIQIAGLLSTQVTSVTTPASATIYVNQALPAGGDGKSWTTAYSDLQTALDEATVGNQIWIAKGTYKPTKPYNLTDPRTVSFQMKNDVAIYGGFEGLREETLAERDFKANETILSGDIGIVGNNADNAYHVFYHPQGLNLNATAILDGVTITGGNATIGGNSNGGGGMFNIGSSPTITNVTFFKNESITTGGAIFNNQSSNPILTNVIFSENAANGHGGGGMYNGSNSNPVLTNIVFNGNLAIGQYGDGNGGAINNYVSSNPKLTNVTFNENKAVYGAGMWNLQSNPVLTNVTISGNITNGSNTGAIHNYDSKSSPKIRNSIIVGNTGKAISGGQATIEHSLLGDHQIGKLYDGVGIPSVDEYKIEDIFIHPDLANPTSANYRLKAGSPAIDKGVSTYPELAQVMKDLDGNDRIRGLSIDLGAYEFLGYKVSYDGNGSTAGQVPTDSQSYGSGNNVTVAGNTDNLEKTGFTFTGWNTQADGSGTSYVENATFLMGTSNVTLYAQWTSNPTFTVTYDGNGATAGVVPIDSQAYVSADSITVAGNTGDLQKSGYTFNSWNTEADGSGTSYTENALLTMGVSNVILYAQWTVIPPIPTYTVTYDGNGATTGVVPIDSQAYVSADSITVAGNTGNLQKSGYTFNGWNTEADGSGTSYAENTTLTMGSSNVTLYAQWTVIAPIPTYTVTYDGNGATTGTVPINQNPYMLGDTVRVEGNLGNLQKPGYTFVGWNTQADGNGTNYAVGTPYTMGTASIVFYAKWKLTPIPNPVEPTPTPSPAPTLVNPQPEPAQEEIEEPKPEVSEPNEPVNSFRDTSTHWARDAIEASAAQGIITGYMDGTFRPNESVSRQHIAVMLQRALDLQVVRQVAAFSDVPTYHTYYEAIMALANAGIIDGYNGNYNPNAPMTRAQLAKILVRAFGLTPGGTSTFADVSENHWSYPYIAALADAGIALGDDGNFHPNEPVTRAQFVTFLYRLMQIK